MRLGPWICVALVALAAWRWYDTRDVERVPGMIAAEDPSQHALVADALERDGFRLLPRAEFNATVRVLHREDYSIGPLARLAPTDFAVGWGPMSDSAVLADIEVSQGNRFYYWRTDTWPIDRREIETHSANWHVIAGNEAVRRVLRDLRAGSLVELRGRLVDIEGRNVSMRTSLKREDTGAGACEIILVVSARVMDP
jgi:hypothetical protein